MKARALLAFAALALSAHPAFATTTLGDALYARRENPADAQAAFIEYEKALAADPSSSEAAWKAARACHWIGDHARQKREKLAWYERGIEIARAAVERHPDSAECRFWLAGLYGSYGEARGVLKSLSLLKPIRRELREVVRIDPTYQGGAGYRVLGIVDYKVPPIAGGNKKRALELLEKSLAIDPEDPFTTYYLAEYFSVVGEREAALEKLDSLRALAPGAEYDAADLKFIQAKGETLRKKLSS